MRENFIFFRNYYEAISQLGEKSQLILYKNVMKLMFNRCETETELEQLCAEIETELYQKRSVFGTFLAIKPSLMKSAKASLIGSFGGAPIDNKNAQKKQPIEEEKEEKEEEEKENIKPPISPLKGSLFFTEEFPEEIQNESSENNPIIAYNCANLENYRIKLVDPFNPLLDKCFDLYRENCANLSKLGFEPRNRKIREDLAEFLAEIDCDIGYFKELCVKANKLRTICNTPIDFKMLIKNHIGISNGKYTDNVQDVQFSNYAKELTNAINTCKGNSK